MLPDAEERAVPTGRRRDVEVERRVLLEGQLPVGAQRRHEEAVGAAGLERQQVLVQEPAMRSEFSVRNPLTPNTAERVYTWGKRIPAENKSVGRKVLSFRTMVVGKIP